MNLCIVYGEAIDFIGELVTDLMGELTADWQFPCGDPSYFYLNIFLRRKQLFEHGSLSCIIDIREKNISEETLWLILQYSSKLSYCCFAPVNIMLRNRDISS